MIVHLSQDNGTENYYKVRWIHHVTTSTKTRGAVCIISHYYDGEFRETFTGFGYGDDKRYGPYCKEVARKRSLKAAMESVAYDGRPNILAKKTRTKVWKEYFSTIGPVRRAWQKVYRKGIKQAFQNYIGQRPNLTHKLKVN